MTTLDVFTNGEPFYPVYKIQIFNHTVVIIILNMQHFMFIHNLYMGF